MLGGSPSISMFSSCLPSLSNILFLIPCAAFAARLGLRKTYFFSCIVGFFAFLLIAAVLYLGIFACSAVICGCLVYAASLTFYAVTWYPLLDNNLTNETRSSFFSRMRFDYMLFNAALFFSLEKSSTKHPPLEFCRQYSYWQE